MAGEVSRLGYNSIVYGLGTILGRFASLLLLPVFTAYLSPSDYGVIALLALIGQFAQSICTLGIGAGMGVVYFEGNDTKRKEACVWTAAAILLGSGIVLFAISQMVAGTLSRLVFSTVEHGSLVVLTMLGVAIHVLATPFLLRYQFEQRAKPFVVLTLIGTAVTLVLSVTFIALFEWGVRGFVMAQTIGYAFGSGLFIAFSCRWTSIRFNRAITRELLRMSFTFIPSFALIYVLLSSNRFILEKIQGLDAVGVYSVGFNLGMAISVVVGAIQTAWYPYFMSFMDRQDEARELFGRILVYYVIGVGAVTLMFFTFARPVAWLMTKPPFHGAHEVVGLVATSQLLFGVYAILLPGLYFAKEVKYISVVQAVPAVTIVLLSLFLIPRFGIFGAALALALSLCVMVSLLVAWNWWRKERYLRVVHDRSRLARFAAGFVTIAAATLVPREFSLYEEFALSIATAGTVFMLVICLLRDGERRALVGMIGRIGAMGLRKHRV